MFVLEHLAQAAAVILLIELIVLLIISLAITGGLAFGLGWVRGRTEPTFEKVNGYVDTGQSYAHRAMDYLALPVIVVGGAGGRVRGSLGAVQRRVRRNRARDEALEIANEAAKPEQQQ